MINKQKLVLFDVDGTLVSGREFLDRYQIFLSEQFSQFFGRPIDIDFLGLYGGTEKENVKILLKRQGLKPSDEELDDFFHVAGMNYITSDKDAILLPYVKETIEKLSERCLLGLSTGNPEIIARKKLMRTSLNDYFKFGAFGNEREHRGELVRLAFNRARLYGWNGNKGNAYVVGDTSKDVESGKYAGIKTVAVMTGSGTREQLENSNPDYLIKNLSELEAILS